MSHHAKTNNCSTRLYILFINQTYGMQILMYKQSEKRRRDANDLS